MKIQCSWCARPLGEKAPLDDPRTSHTICPACTREMLLETIIDAAAAHPVPCHFAIRAAIDAARATLRTGDAGPMPLGEADADDEELIADLIAQEGGAT
jgi:hypothetical protein